jgi:hypothetical protein
LIKTPVGLWESCRGVVDLQLCYSHFGALLLNFLEILAVKSALTEPQAPTGALERGDACDATRLAPASRGAQGASSSGSSVGRTPRWPRSRDLPRPEQPWACAPCVPRPHRAAPDPLAMPAAGRLPTHHARPPPPVPCCLAVWRTSPIRGQGRPSRVRARATVSLSSPPRRHCRHRAASPHRLQPRPLIHPRASLDPTGARAIASFPAFRRSSPEFGPRRTRRPGLTTGAHRSTPDLDPGHQSVLGVLNCEPMPLVCHLHPPLAAGELAATAKGMGVRKVNSRAHL